ncbi:MAG: OmpH family outer membrane protein [Elusimicrobiota bacterium]
MRTIAVFLLLAASPALGLEVSIEENRAERGSIGYVDLHKVFQLFPQTHKAKQSFAEIVRQAEEQVNLRKGELIGLRSELSRLTLELELLQKTPIPVPPPPFQPAEVAPSTGAPSGSGERPPSGDGAPLRASSSQESTAVVSTPSGEKPLTIHLPGLTTSPILVELPPVSSTGTAPSGEAPAPVEPPAAVQAPQGPTAQELAAAAAQARQEQVRGLETRLADKKRELAAKEEEFQKHQTQVEKNLIELEGKRTEMLLGKIYVVVQEVARESGVSVVVDKSQILYGQRTVDLTDRVVKKLEGLQL